MAENPREPLREAINKNRDDKNHAAPQVRATPSSGETPESSAIISGYKPSGPGDHKEAGSDGERGEHSDPYAKRAIEAAETQAEYSRWQAWVGISGAIVGGLAAIFTGWAAWAAAIAARAAAASNEIARETAVRELRAYVHISAARREEGIISIKIKNFGQTPAHNVRNDKAFVVHFTSDRGKINYSESEISVDIPPGQEIIDVCPINRGDAIFNSPEVILYGRIRYFTAFSEIEQITQYEMIVEPIDGPLVVSVGGIKCKQAQ